MPKLSRSSALLLTLATSLLSAQQALAQPGGFGGGGAPPQQQGEDKKEGPAEEAPEDKQALRPVEPVPAQPRRLRRVQLFELDGYLRLRGDYFHRMNLGLDDTDLVEGSEDAFKFFAPPAESPEIDENGDILGPNDARCYTRLTTNGVTEQRAVNRCQRRNGFASANMRLRLEPTLHITDSVSVHSQIDIFDNLVLGSTPDSYNADYPGAPLNMFTRSQVVPQAGVNSSQDSIVAKRAWGRIKFGWGLDLQFGRMPWSWGMGLVANHGNGYARGEQADIIRHLDRDYGDSVDSVNLAFEFGKDRRKTHRVALSWDWASSGPTTAQILGNEYASGGTIGQEFSIEKFDNVYQWSASILRRDNDEMLRRKIALGAPVVNYGFITWVRYQDVDTAYGADPNSISIDDRERLEYFSNVLVHRRAIVASPDLWFRLNWRTLRIELEVAGNFGVFNLRDIQTEIDGQSNYFERLTIDDQNRQTIANVGYAFEFKYGFFQDRFHIGLDQGFATGDSARPLDSNPLNPLTSGIQNQVSAFRFNPAFNTDLLLFREVLGTISNTVYFKPWAAFYFFDHFSGRIDVEYALAHQRQSTLGDRYSYGIEIDAAARYHDQREPIFFQLQYGVLFPLGAFNRIRVNPDGTSSGRENARALQTLQAQLGIRF